MTWEPTLQVIPNLSLGFYQDILTPLLYKSKATTFHRSEKGFRQVFFPCFTSRATHLMYFVRAYGEEWSQGTLWTKLTRNSLSLLSFRL